MKAEYEDFLEAVVNSEFIQIPLELRSPLYRQKLKAFTERVVAEMKKEESEDD